MNKVKALLLMGMILFGLVNAVAQLMPNVRIRGVITAFDGHQLQLKTRYGKDIKLPVADDARISELYPIKLREIKKGTFVGITAIQSGPRAPLRALEVHLFPEEMRGTGEGHYGWDLEPSSSMTNANVDAVVTANNGKVLTLSYKGGKQRIFVPLDVPVVSFKPADRSLLTAGAQVFVVAQQAADGSLTAERISVGKDGMQPPM